MSQPWYREFWAWFLLIPVLTSVCVGSFFLYMSIVTADGLVSDDYYKEGRAFNRTYERDQAAIQMNLQGELTLDSLTGDLRLQLQGDAPRWPETLTLDIIHPTQQGFDQTLTLIQLSGSLYAAQLEREVIGPRILEMTPGPDEWRLRARTRWPDQNVTRFRPIQPR